MDRSENIYKHIVMTIVAGVALGADALAQDTKGLKEPDIAKLIELQIDDATIFKRLSASGVAFTTDQAALDRLKDAGASEAVLDAVRKAGAAVASNAAAPAVAITYQKAASTGYRPRDDLEATAKVADGVRARSQPDR
jgi:hypothetical protein